MIHQSSFAVIYWLISFPLLPRPHLSLTSTLLSHTSHTHTCQQPLHLTPSSRSNQEKNDQINKIWASQQKQAGKTLLPQLRIMESLNACSCLTTGQTTVYLLLKTLWYDQKIEIELMDLSFFFPFSKVITLMGFGPDRTETRLYRCCKNTFWKSMLGKKSMVHL